MDFVGKAYGLVRAVALGLPILLNPIRDSSASRFTRCMMGPSSREKLNEACAPKSLSNRFAL